MTSDRGCEYRVNSTGPRTDPLRNTKDKGVLVWTSTTTERVLSLRYDSNQDSATPEITKVLSSRLNRMAWSWSWVSKASLRSNSGSIDTSFWPVFVRRPSSKFKKKKKKSFGTVIFSCTQTVELRISCLRTDETAVEEELSSLASSKRMGDLRLIWNFLNH